MALSQQLIGNDIYRVNKITITGNDTYTKSQILRQMELHSGKLSTFWRGAEFNKRILELDLINIRNFYRGNGFINSALEDSFAVIDNRKVALWIHINEGEQYYLRQINFTGNYTFTDEKLREYIEELEINSPFNQYVFQQAIQNIESAYRNRGKLFAAIRFNLNFENNGIYISIAIEENQTVTINSIRIDSVENVKKDVVEREILFTPGDEYSEEELRESQRRIFETGLFADINITPIPVSEDSQQVDLRVSLRTMDFRTVRFDLGARQYEPTSGAEPYTALEASVEWMHRNLMESARQLSLSAAGRMTFEDWSLLPTGEIRYTEPWLWKIRIPTTFRVYSDYTVPPGQLKPIYEWGSDITFLHSRRRRLIVRSILRYQETFIRGSRRQESDSTPIDTSTARTLVRGQDRSVRVLFRRDERDNFLYPNQGYFIEIEPEFFVDIFGGTSNFYRIEAALSRYWSILGGATLAGRVKAGSIHFYDGVHGFIPDYEFFYLGGATSVRGFASDRLKTETVIENGDVKRVPSGNFVKLIGNLELRFPIYWKFGGELFFDAGQLWPDYSALNILSMRYTAGFGITFATPLGPARVDFGRKLGPLKPGEKPWVTNLALQYAF